MPYARVLPNGIQQFTLIHFSVGAGRAGVALSLSFQGLCPAGDEFFDLIIIKIHDGTFSQSLGRRAHRTIPNHAAGKHKFVSLMTMEGVKIHHTFHNRIAHVNIPHFVKAVQ